MVYYKYEISGRHQIFLIKQSSVSITIEIATNKMGLGFDTIFYSFCFLRERTILGQQ